MALPLLDFLESVPNEHYPEPSPIHPILENTSHIPCLPQSNMSSIHLHLMNRKRIDETQYLRTLVTSQGGDLRTALDEFYSTGTVVIDDIMDLYELHHKRYDRLCPPVTEIDHPDWVRWINHCESIQHLRAWTPRFPQGKEHSTIPNRKLPNKLMHVHIDQHAYEEWARAYNESLIEMLNGPWVAYQNAKANVERALTNVVASGTLSAGGVGRIRMHWQRCLEEFNEWENKVPKLSLLSWVGTVTQVYRALIDRVEYGWVFLERFLMSAPEEIQACWWKRLLTAQGVVDIAQLQDIVPANLRERLLLGDEHAV